MTKKPKEEKDSHRGSGKLADKVAIITGGDSGIGRAVAIAFAKEGADVAIVYLNEHEDANEAKRLVEEKGRRCLLLPGDVGDENFCRDAVEKRVTDLGKLNVVNNSAEQHPPSGQHREDHQGATRADLRDQHTPSWRSRAHCPPRRSHLFRPPGFRRFVITGQVLHPNGGELVNG